MKKIIYLLLSLTIMIFSICACDTNTKNLEKSNGNIENQNNELTNAKKSANNLSEENLLNEKKQIENQEVIQNEESDTSKSKSGENMEIISATVTPLSNQKCAWGFVRKKDARPEIYAPHAKVLDEFEGIYLGNPDEKVIYLTFDEGYENGYTASILDTLQEKEVCATFFVTMPYVKQNPDLVQRMIEEGHIVGNHTVNHPSMPEVTNDEKLKKEITELHDYVKENFSYDMEFLRPPKGEYSERTVAISKELGYRTVLWSSAYADWDPNKQKGSEYAKGMILNYLHNGCVMLLHAVSKDNDAVLGEVIDEIRDRGYEIKALSEFTY